MAEKTVDAVDVDAKIAEYEEMIAKLKAEKEKLEAQKNFQPYPKHIQVPAPSAEPTAPTQTVVVNSAAEEEAVLKPTKAVKAEKK